LARYYAESEASRYRAAQFAGGSAAQRHHHLLRGNASWMGRVAEEHAPGPHPSYADVRTFAPELFDEIADLGIFGRRFSVTPWVPLEGRCSVPVTTVLETDLWRVD